MSTKKIVRLTILFLVTMGCIAVAIFMPFNSKLSDVDFYINDANSNYQYETREMLEFCVTDSNAVKNRELTWHFGNGDKITEKGNVKYRYKKDGEYLVTLNIENKASVSKYIRIVSGEKYVAIDSVPKIHGTDVAYQGEELVFSAEGPGADTWYWEFGETGTVDAYEQQVVYIYENTGRYRVKLRTNMSQYPVYHYIIILPRFEKIEEVVAIDSISIAENDIKIKLQAIANAGVRDRNIYRKNVNYIKNKYLCGNIGDVVVFVNGEKYNDFYSYCQGLHFLESTKKNRVSIDEVEIEKLRCLEIINVTQSSNTQ